MSHLTNTSTSRNTSASSSSSGRGAAAGNRTSVSKQSQASSRGGSKSSLLSSSSSTAPSRHSTSTTSSSSKRTRSKGSNSSNSTITTRTTKRQQALKAGSSSSSSANIPSKPLIIKTPHLSHLPLHEIATNSSSAASPHNDASSSSPGASGSSHPCKNLLISFNHLKTLLPENDSSHQVSEYLPILKQILKLTIMSCLLETTKGIEYFSHLQLLNLQSNSIADLHGLGELKNLTEVNLDSNQLEEKALEEAFTNCRRLEILSICHNHLRQFHSNWLQVAQNALKELNLTDNQISQLNSHFGRGFQVLQELNLSHNPLGPSLGKSSFAKSVRNTLTVLKLDQCQIESFASWKPFRRVTQLHLENNRISSLKEIPQLFPSLEILNLKHNKLASLKTLHPLKDLSESFSVLKVAGNPLCSEADYVEEIHKLMPHLSLVDAQEFDIKLNLLKKEEKELFDDLDLDFNMGLKNLKHQLDQKERKKEQEKNSDGTKSASEIEVLDPATEKFLKQLDAKRGLKPGAVGKEKASKEGEFVIPHDEARALYEECQKAQDVVEQKFSDISSFMNTPYENIHYDKKQKKIITKTTTVRPDDIRNVSRPPSAAPSGHSPMRPSSVASSLTAASFDEYFQPAGAADLDLEVDNEDDASDAGSQAENPEAPNLSSKSRLKRRFQDAQSFSSQMMDTNGQEEEFNHQRLFESTGLNRKPVVSSDQILQELNIRPVKSAASKKRPAKVKSGRRRFRVPKHLLEKAQAEKKSEQEAPKDEETSDAK